MEDREGEEEIKRKRIEERNWRGEEGLWRAGSRRPRGDVSLLN